MGALFHQPLICFSSVSSHVKLLPLYMLLEKIRPSSPAKLFLVSSSFAKDWLPHCIPSVCLGGSSGRGYRRPCELLPWERRTTGSLPLSLLSHTYGSAVLAQLAELGGCSQHEKLSQQNWAPISTKNMTKHLQSCKNHMADAAVHFLYSREKVMIIYSVCLKAHLL